LGKALARTRAGVVTPTNGCVLSFRAFRKWGIAYLNEHELWR